MIFRGRTSSWFTVRVFGTETALQVFRPIFGPFDFGLFTRPGNLKTSVKQNPGRPPVGRRRIRNGTKIKLGTITSFDNVGFVL